jgi:aspartyl-tRNA synthetase
MERTLACDVAAKTEQTVLVKGWVNARRDHGGLIFVDIRDHSGIVQLVVQPDNEAVFTVAEELRDEYVVAASGVVKQRDPTLVNPNIASGTVEVIVSQLTILNKSETLPILVNSSQPISEELRLKYRYLDLRREKMQTMLKRRAAFYSFIRSYMEQREFTEVATPILANSSPEGARDFLVPSRVHASKFYALPQAPQQFKQLLMVGGLQRYYQIATCFRDEDPRADRLYGDFYQLDLEMSFVEDGEEVRSTMEPLITRLVGEFAGKKLLHETIPRIPYQEAMDRFGSDKPDLRYGMELVDLTDMLGSCEFGIFRNAAADGGRIKAICVSGGASLSRSQLDVFTDKAKSLGAGGMPYMAVEHGLGASSISKFFTEEQLRAIVEAMSARDGDLIVFGADTRGVVNAVLGGLRIAFADHFGLKDPNIVALAWIIDFPFYERDEKNGQT